MSRQGSPAAGGDRPGREGLGRAAPGGDAPGREGLGRAAPGGDAPGREGLGRAAPGGDAPGREGALVLYRCPTPTDLLCPCGAVARALRRRGLEYRTVRVPYRRGERPEIVELTGQRRVPVLVHGEEVIHDSRRIREYLDFAFGEPVRR
ncbi:MAG: glutathione S-transferase N-terminal domain-containing protein [Solirubrobacterales bacterium]